MSQYIRSSGSQWVSNDNDKYRIKSNWTFSGILEFFFILNLCFFSGMIVLLLNESVQVEQQLKERAKLFAALKHFQTDHVGPL